MFYMWLEVSSLWYLHIFTNVDRTVEVLQDWVIELFVDYQLACQAGRGFALFCLWHSATFENVRS